MCSISGAIPITTPKPAASSSAVPHQLTGEQLPEGHSRAFPPANKAPEIRGPPLALSYLIVPRICGIRAICGKPCCGKTYPIRFFVRNARLRSRANLAEGA